MHMRKAGVGNKLDIRFRLAELSGRLRHGSAVARAARSVLAGDRLTSVQPLFSALLGGTRRSTTEREAAALALGAAGLDETDRRVSARLLVAVLAQNPREKWIPRFARALGWGFLAFL